MKRRGFIARAFAALFSPPATMHDRDVYAAFADAVPQYISPLSFPLLGQQITIAQLIPNSTEVHLIQFTVDRIEHKMAVGPEQSMVLHGFGAKHRYRLDMALDDVWVEGARLIWDPWKARRRR